MAEARAADGTKLYYERTGAGAPVLLVMGLGMNATGWWRTIPVLAEGLEVIAFDNRGAGRSDVPDGPYTAYVRVLRVEGERVIDHIVTRPTRSGEEPS